MGSVDRENNDGARSGQTEQAAPARGPTVASRRLFRSIIPDSELTETYCPICADDRRRFLFEDYGFPVWKCRQCGHMYVSPVPSEKVLSEFYTSGFMPHTDDENVWERIRSDLFDAAARAVAGFVPQRGDLLEVGPGFGGFLVRAARDGWRLWCAEPNGSAVEVCRRRLQQEARLRQCSFEQADFQPESFDCIVMLNVIEHICDPVKICRHAFELLRPGGCLALRWPQYAFRRTLDAPHHLHGFTRRSTQRLFLSTGFSEVREFWANIQDYRKERLKQRLAGGTLRLAARVFFTCTFGKRQIPFVSRLTLGRKPA